MSLAKASIAYTRSSRDSFSGSMSTPGVEEDTAYRMIHDELTLDGSTLLNVASFVQTYMPPCADKLVKENVSKNLIDADEYPATQMMHSRCVSMIADLWHAPSAKEAIGTATTGSSEAVHLGGLAMKKIWQKARKAAGKSIHEPGYVIPASYLSFYKLIVNRPNIVMSANAQVALEKFARYFDVECRLVPVSEESRYHLDVKKAMEHIDENTIGVFVILGSTYTGHYEDVKALAELLDDFEARSGCSVPIHVDAASGGFIVPFTHPDLLWDFRIPRVVSINASGHKFGMTYVGVGWIIWRDKAHLPEDLIFELHYLGSTEFTFSLTFSRGAAPIVAQYFNLLHLGFQGYRKVALDNFKNARSLSRALEKSGYFVVLSDVHRAKGTRNGHGIDSPNFEDYEAGLPVVAFKFSDEFKKCFPHLQQKWIQTLLRTRGWLIPNYNLCPDCQDIEILRVVVKENMTEMLVQRFIDNLFDVIEVLTSDKEAQQSFLSPIDTSRVDSDQRLHGIQIRPEESKHSGTYARPC
ncbi:hypothetical protein AGABI1DRAFT_118390 [Agaricus bisporus var. burnettii JB137-S8]|uniref:Glutamate decarboxylase n=1 Tax=Agaricus bisporus var. burnettii (strain JB137-S8 / ATCC MYA-4627 / FGSC 10392) TaxID=597362 RepID=K5Y4L7_AGABU|nr:uncharacterized protein AGABI1DRAFT_118390 [Agaricus bisporus var. burnettii JB137-S8]EKM82990.1 hypothetical protein AGABI1DRAFT_118390 [Agaricus bisporus var. burnettii JB137-S8]